MLTLFPPTQNQTKSLEARMKFNLLFELITEKKSRIPASYICQRNIHDLWSSGTK